MSTVTDTGVGAQSPFLATFPGRYYYDPAIFAREQERIFARMWVYGGVANSLAKPGDYRTLTIANESVIVVRTKQGDLRAFLNVCRHRGSRLCPEASGRLNGSIQCRYHAWTYALDGRLIGAPNVFNRPEFERDLYGLHPVALEVWQGLVGSTSPRICRRSPRRWITNRPTLATTAPSSAMAWPTSSWQDHHL